MLPLAVFCSHPLHLAATLLHSPLFVLRSFHLNLDLFSFTSGSLDHFSLSPLFFPFSFSSLSLFFFSLLSYSSPSSRGHAPPPAGAPLCRPPSIPSSPCFPPAQASPRPALLLSTLPSPRAAALTSTSSPLPPIHRHPHLRRRSPQHHPRRAPPSFSGLFSPPPPRLRLPPPLRRFPLPGQPAPSPCSPPAPARRSPAPATSSCFWPASAHASSRRRPHPRRPPSCFPGSPPAGSPPVDLPLLQRLLLSSAPCAVPSC